MEKSAVDSIQGANFSFLLLGSIPPAGAKKAPGHCKHNNRAHSSSCPADPGGKAPFGVLRYAALRWDDPVFLVFSEVHRHCTRKERKVKRCKSGAIWRFGRACVIV